jgi:hypothetical protein
MDNTMDDRCAEGCGPNNSIVHCSVGYFQKRMKKRNG